MLPQAGFEHHRAVPALLRSMRNHPAAIAAYLGGSDAFDTALTDFAQRYADQNERLSGIRQGDPIRAAAALKGV